MSATKNQDGKIFISYRRSDAQGVAGRLGDTLGAYFGDNRVFRDIEDIAGGEDFGHVIKKSLQSADAVIVLIGQNWLSANDDKGQRRLDDPNDWVVQEIIAAMELGIPIYPVLIEDTPMPREVELPHRLQPLTRFNAISISDKRWKYDVLRLGKIISFDIPSANEKKLDSVRAAISLALFVSLTLTAGLVVWNFIKVDSEFEFEFELLHRWQSGVPFVVIIASALILFWVIDLIEGNRRRFIYASIFTGAIGSLIFFIISLFLNENQEAMVTFFGAVLVGTLMFAFMNMSGFKAK